MHHLYGHMIEIEYNFVGTGEDVCSIPEQLEVSSAHPLFVYQNVSDTQMFPLDMP